MKHLTDEQLSARHDGVLSGPEAAEVDAHLTQCAECRARLAEVAVLDVSLEDSLTHDPGEEYFSKFADRVAARIAAEGGQEGTAPAREPRPARSPWAWLLTPPGPAA